jgi:hypothetical protein
LAFQPIFSCHAIRKKVVLFHIFYTPPQHEKSQGGLMIKENPASHKKYSVKGYLNAPKKGLLSSQEISKQSSNAKNK